MELICEKCNTAKTISNDKLAEHSGKVMSVKCKNPSCGERIKFQVPTFRKKSPAKKPIQKASQPKMEEFQRV